MKCPTKAEQAAMNKAECFHILSRVLKCNVEVPNAPVTRRMRMDGMIVDELGRKSLLTDRSKTGEVFRAIVKVNGITSHQISEQTEIKIGIVTNVLTRLYKRELILRDKRGAQYFYYV